MTKKKLIIVVLDIGSSSIRCSAYEKRDISSNENNLCFLDFASTKRNVRTLRFNSGRVFINDDEPSHFYLFDVIDTLIDETIHNLNKNVTKYQIIGLGISQFTMNLIAVNNQGQSLGEVFSMSYACNTRLVDEEVEQLKSDLGKDQCQQLYELTGTPMHSGYALPQLRTLYRNNSNEDNARIYMWQTIAAVCLCRWVGLSSLPISYCEASWTGLLNYHTCQYEESILKLLPQECRKALPTLADFDQEIEVLMNGIPQSSPYSQRWPDLCNTRFFLGVGDGACANIGSKCSTPNRIACTVGTSAAARLVLRTPMGSQSVSVLPGLFCYRIDREHILFGGALTDGGSVVEWAQQLLNLNDDEAFQKCMKEVNELAKADCTDHDAQVSMSMLPFLSGERSTGYRGGATGAIIGITRDTTPAMLLKSCLEGVTLRLYAIIKLLLDVRGYDDNKPKIIVSGKAMEVNAAWRQMLADCCDLEVSLDDETQEGTSRGCALLVAMAFDTANDERIKRVEYLQQEKLNLWKDSTPNEALKDTGN